MSLLVRLFASIVVAAVGSGLIANAILGMGLVRPAQVWEGEIAVIGMR